MLHSDFLHEQAGAIRLAVSRAKQVAETKSQVAHAVQLVLGREANGARDSRRFGI